MSANVRLDGVAELTRKLAKLSLVTRGQVLRKALRAGAKPVIAAAKANIPEGADSHYVARRIKKGRAGYRVFPGFAKRSIKAVVTLSKDKMSGSAVIGVKRDAFYAVQFVELGTSRMAPQPWLVPALENTQAQQESALAQILKREIEKVARG